MIRVCPLSALPRGEALPVDVEEGSVEGRDVLAVYSRGDTPVGVLGMNQSRLFGRWRRQLNSAVMA